MFELDFAVLNWCLQRCRELGNVFGYGAFEGFITYTSIILLGYFTVTNKKKVK